MDIKKDFDSDCYIKNKNLFLEYRKFKNKKRVIDFNHASLARPYEQVFKKINSKIEETLRKELSQITSINNPSQIIFGRNTTEALSFTYWLANVEGGNVVITDAENESIIRIFKEHRDHGNTNKKDGWSTFPDEIISENFRGIKKKQNTNVKVKMVKLLGNFKEESILKKIDKKTKLVVFSHIIRNNGKIIDIMKIAKKIKKRFPNVFIAIDGAQAFGNVPEVNFKKFEKSGIDFYAATPHKTLGSYPLGILFVSKNTLKNVSSLKDLPPEKQIIFNGMFDKSLNVKPTINSSMNPLRFLSLKTSLDKLKKEKLLSEKKFSGKIKRVLKIKTEFLKYLIERNVEIEKVKPQSPAIVSFRIKNKDNQKIVKQLQERGVFCSYISETDNIRVSFEITNKKGDVKNFFKIFDLLNSNSLK